MNQRKLLQYIALSFGISWLMAALIYVLPIEYGSWQSLVILALFYMPAPAYATIILQRFVYRESLQKYGWQLDKAYIPQILLLTPALFLLWVILMLLLVVLGGNLMGIEIVGELSFSKDVMIEQIQAMVPEGTEIPADFPIPPVLLLVISVFSAIATGFTLNLPFTFGEELGWRGLMLKELQSLGYWKSNFLIGMVWGLWHAPIIMMGHNFPNFPYLGVGIMTLFCIGISYVHAYVRLKAQSILTPSAFHGMINAVAGGLMLYMANGHELVAHPAGFIGIAAGFIIAIGIALFDPPFVQDYRKL